MELKEGQRLRVKVFDETPSHWRVDMKKWMGKIVTFKKYSYSDNIKIYQDSNEFNGEGWYWYESDFQIVFDTWEDVYKVMNEECNKYTGCKNCPLKKEIYCYRDYLKDDENHRQLAENFKKMFGMEYYVLDDNNDDKINFTLKNIEDEMIVKLRNGIVYISLGENFIGENGFMPKHGYSQNFKCYYNDSNFDIIEVYPKNDYHTDGFKGMLIIDENKKPLWKDEPVTKDISLEEINALLREKYPYVEKFNLPIDK